MMIDGVGALVTSGMVHQPGADPLPLILAG